FTIATKNDVETTLLLLAVGLIAGELVLRARRSARAAAASRREIQRMRRHAEIAAGSDTPGRLIEDVREELVELFPVGRGWFDRPPFPTSMPQLRHGRVAMPTGDPELGPLDPEGTRLVELRVMGNGQVLGRFVLEFASPTVGVELPPAARDAALGLADQLGAALAA